MRSANDTLSDTLFNTRSVIDWNLLKINNFGGSHLSIDDYQQISANHRESVGKSVRESVGSIPHAHFSA